MTIGLGAKPLPQLALTWLTLFDWHIYASLGLTDLIAYTSKL